MVVSNRPRPLTPFREFAIRIHSHSYNIKEKEGVASLHNVCQKLRVSLPPFDSKYS